MSISCLQTNPSIGARKRRLRRASSLLFATLFLITLTTRSQAFEVVIESVDFESEPNATVTGHFDVFIRPEEGETVLPDIAAWQATVDLVDPTGGLTFTGAGAPSAPHPPLIDESFFVDPMGTDDEERASAYDAVIAPFGSVPLVDGAGLMRIHFEVAPRTAGLFEVSLDLDPNSGTFLVDGDANEVGFLAVDGIIQVPEPSPWLAHCAALACIWMLRVWTPGASRRPAGERR